MQEGLPAEIEAKAKEWLQSPYDEETQIEVRHLLEEDLKQCFEAFYSHISFGTGGIRGVMGAGTNRLNRYTIGMVTQGLAHHILEQSPHRPRFFISYDSRHHSRSFAEESARVLAGNGIEVLITKQPYPTPFVSFGCRYHHCSGAIMITASHNPPEYNGYKVYGQDGGQVAPPHDAKIMHQIQLVTHPHQVKKVPLNHPSIRQVGEEEEKAYHDALFSLQHYPKDNQALGNRLKLVYSPLHGTGMMTVPSGLRRWGFTSIRYVEKQKNADGDFSYAKIPNPAYPPSLEMGIKQLQESESDLFLATDPDADRIGAVVIHQNQPIILSGNQIAVLTAYYLCQTLQATHKTVANGAFISTIVTTPLFKRIANSFHYSCFEVLTGFKYIGEKIHQWEKSRAHTFIFGAEESFGYLYGTHARDKDATIMACLLSEMALQQKKRGKTLVDLLHQIYRQFGLFHEQQRSISSSSSSQGEERTEKVMSSLRQRPPLSVCGQRVILIQDYELGYQTEIDTKRRSALSLPRSNVLSFLLEDQSVFILRPSGTEALIKLYGMIHLEHYDSVEKGLKWCEQLLTDRMDWMEKQMTLLL